MADTRGICICAIFKNEAPYLKEWVAYNQVVGVDHFVLFDNGSTDGGGESLRGNAAVTLIDWPERPGQLTAYQHFISNYAKSYTWVAFIDIDEFIHPLRDDNIPALLQRAGDHPAMLLHWMNFGPAGHRTRAPGLVLEDYTLRLPLGNSVNSHIKSIARSEGLVRAHGCHVMQFEGLPCNAAGETITNDPIQPSIYSETAVLNHYYTKSWEDWCLKVQRGRATTADDPELQRKIEWFQYYEQKATESETRIQRFLPAVKATLGIS